MVLTQPTQKSTDNAKRAWDGIHAVQEETEREKL